MTQKLKCLPSKTHRVQIPEIHTNARWVWQPTCNSALEGEDEVPRVRWLARLAILVSPGTDGSQPQASMCLHTHTIHLYIY